MKKFTLIALASFFAVASYGQGLTGVSTLNKRMARQCTLSQRAEKATFGVKKEGAKKVSAKEDVVISEAPEGTLYENMYVNSESYGLGWGSIYFQVVDGGVAGVVEGKDGCLYMQGPISQAYIWGLGTPWIKLDKVSDGVYEMKTPQLYCLDGTDKYYIRRLKVSDDQSTFLTDSTNTTVRFQWKDHKLTQLDDCAYGLVDETDEWFYMADYDVVYSVNTDQLVQKPESVDKYVLKMTYRDDATSEFSKTYKMVNAYVDPASSTGEVYIDNMESDLSEALVKAQIAQDGVIVPTRQYLGVDDIYNSHMYLLTGDAFVETEDDYTYFNYNQKDTAKFVPDAAMSTFTAAYPSSLIVNCGRKNLYIYDEYVAPVLTMQEDKPMTSADPTIVDHTELTYFDILKFNIPTVDVDGNDLNTTALSYCIYYDDKVKTFDPADYKGLSAPQSEFKYDFSDSEYDFYYSSGTKNTTIYLYDQNYGRVGVQSIYRGGNEEHRSAIVYVNRSTYSAVNDVNASKTVKSVSYYNVAGQRIDAPVSGFAIKRVEYTDGTSETAKIVK